jgi:hypothetical protein
MTTQPTARGTRTARNRAAASAQQRTAAQKRAPAAGAATEERAPAAPRRGRAAGAAEQKRTEAAPSPNGGRGIRLPVIGARIPLPPPPTGLPGPAHVLWLGGLVGAAALGVVEWPVAAALAAGTWVIERFAKAAVREELRHAGERRE